MKFKDRITGELFSLYEARLVNNAILVDEAGQELDILPMPSAPTKADIKRNKVELPAEVKGSKDPRYAGCGRKRAGFYSELQQDCYLIIKYGNRKLYDTQECLYLTDPLRSLLKLQQSQNKPIKVLHNETKRDITALTLKVAEHNYGPEGVLTKYADDYRLFNNNKNK